MDNKQYVTVGEQGDIKEVSPFGSKSKKMKFFYVNEDGSFIDDKVQVCFPLNMDFEPVMMGRKSYYQTTINCQAELISRNLWEFLKKEFE